MANKRNRPTAPKKSAPRSAAPAQTSAQKRLAAQRAMAAATGAQAARRRRLAIAISPVVVIVVVLAVFIGIKVADGNKVGSGAKATGAPTSVTGQVTNVPAATLNAVGKGTISTPPTALSGAALTADGKPRILFVGAEFCPYCAAERWALAVALSRFGTLTGLGEITSSPTDAYPSTATLTFHGASYTSTHLSLTAKEIYSNQASGSYYATLDTLDASDAALFKAVGKDSFPFVDIGGKYMISGASYDPQTLQGLSQAQIAADLSNPNSVVAKGIDGTANVITAAICAITDNQPSAVCTSAGVTAGKAVLPGAGT